MIPVMGLSRRGFLRLACGAGAASLLAGGYVVGIEPTWLRVVRHECRLAGLDARLDGLRLVQLSDLHVGAGVPLDFLREAVDDALALDPDAIVVTGDFVHRGGDEQALRDLADVAGRLHAPLGVYGVLGNHDCGFYGRGRVESTDSMAQVRGTLAESGMQVLTNQAVTLDGNLRLVGYGDLWAQEFHPESIALDSPTVALSHNPDTAPALAEQGADLVLCGHTHGGQVRIPFLGPPILPVERREYSAGPYDVGATRLYVNRGVGWLRRVRLFVRPEVTLHVLRQKSSTLA